MEIVIETGQGYIDLSLVQHITKTITKPEPSVNYIGNRYQVFFKGGGNVILIPENCQIVIDKWKEYINNK